jgi:hypothetical protein
MVALAGLFEIMHVLVEFLLGRERCAVDPLQLSILLAPTPVRSGVAEELDRPDFARAVHVWSATEVDEVPLLIDAQVAVAELFDQLQLVWLVSKELERLFLTQRPALKWLIPLDARCHVPFDHLEIVRRERTWQFKVVVEAVLDGWSDAEFGLREDGDHGLGHHMCGAVPHTFQWRHFFSITSTVSSSGMAPSLLCAALWYRVAAIRWRSAMSEIEEHRPGEVAGRAPNSVLPVQSSEVMHQAAVEDVPGRQPGRFPAANP